MPRSEQADAQARYRERQRELMGLLWELYVRRCAPEDRWLLWSPPRDRLERLIGMVEALIAQYTER